MLSSTSSAAVRLDRKEAAHGDETRDRPGPAFGRDGGPVVTTLDENRAAPLSQAEIDAFQRDGFVLPEFRIPQRLVDCMRDSVDALIARNPELRPEQLVNPHLAAWNNLPNPYRACAFDPGLLDLVEQVLGPDIIFWSSHLLCKPAGDGQAIPWHQDGEYWPIRPPATLTVWVALDRADEENGAMRMLPQSNASSLPHVIVARSHFRQEIPSESIDESRAVDVVRDPGQISLHNIRTVHASRPNASGRRRAAIIFRYMPATSVFERDATLLRGKVTYPIWDTPIFLARGIDRSGRNNFQHGHSADFSA